MNNCNCLEENSQRWAGDVINDLIIASQAGAPQLQLPIKLPPVETELTLSPELKTLVLIALGLTALKVFRIV